MVSPTPTPTLLQPTLPMSKSQKRKQERRELSLQAAVLELDLNDPRFLDEKIQVESALQYNFKDLILLREAMYTLKWYAARLPNGVLLKEANYGLAQYGDGVLRDVLLACWFGQLGPDNTRMLIGKVQQRVQAVITDKYLKKVADDHGITDLIRKWYPTAMMKEPGEKGIATTIEALIGAVAIDSGGDREVLRKLLVRLLGVEL
ncbi:uncharacterized protein RCC_10927 [Ramularia collo-cygni]|uniref:RNase III domain-containing protein n=1 Tax=Ramularia collo-cygni TaxID=112498 RepID=A0A2D3VRW4_9PEZI|nr:uncharacterized protein RCC_10927 [Ramularia collo-cygni]CZT25198.1 uncharacterized protein RCC_10927 [Ramularia collo-cygni]